MSESEAHALTAFVLSIAFVVYAARQWCLFLLAERKDERKDERLKEPTDDHES